jgi:hypothetical protein
LDSANNIFLGDYEKAELGTLNLFLKQDSLFIDIGANFGLYTLNASKIIGKDGGIISFEPFSVILRRLMPIFYQIV